MKQQKKEHFFVQKRSSSMKSEASRILALAKTSPRRNFYLSPQLVQYVNPFDRRRNSLAPIRARFRPFVQERDYMNRIIDPSVFSPRAPSPDRIPATAPALLSAVIATPRSPPSLLPPPPLLPVIASLSVCCLLSSPLYSLMCIILSL